MGPLSFLLIFSFFPVFLILALSLWPFLYSFSLPLLDVSTSLSDETQADPYRSGFFFFFFLFFFFFFFLLWFDGGFGIQQCCVGCGSRFWFGWAGVLSWWLVEFSHWLRSWIGVSNHSLFLFFFLIFGRILVVVAVNLWHWWLWVCYGYEFGNGFVPVVVWLW